MVAFKMQNCTNFNNTVDRVNKLVYNTNCTKTNNTVREGMWRYVSYR